MRVCDKCGGIKALDSFELQAAGAVRVIGELCNPCAGKLEMMMSEFLTFRRNTKSEKVVEEAVSNEG